MRLVTSAVMATLALTLGACGGDDPPPPEPTTSATTPANPDATLPPMPDVASQDSPWGASKFVQHYVDALNYAALTGDASVMRSLSSRDCEGCMAYVELFEKTYRDGGYFTGGAWSLDKGAATRYTSSDEPAWVTATISIAEGTQKLAATESPSKTVAKRSVLTFEIVPGSPRQIAEIMKGDFE